MTVPGPVPPLSLKPAIHPQSQSPFFPPSRPSPHSFLLLPSSFGISSLSLAVLNYGRICRQATVRGSIFSPCSYFRLPSFYHLTTAPVGRSVFEPLSPRNPRAPYIRFSLRQEHKHSQLRDPVISRPRQTHCRRVPKSKFSRPYEVLLGRTRRQDRSSRQRTIPALALPRSTEREPLERQVPRTFTRNSSIDLGI